MGRIGTLGLAIMIAGSVALAGCTTVRNARDRIVKPTHLCADVTVQIYFEPDSAEVTSEGRAVLRAAAAEAKACTIEQVAVLGLADAAGAPDANQTLSEHRAEAVAKALAAIGLPTARFETSAAGQAGSMSPSGDTRPLRRRADVTLKLAPLKR